MTTDLLELETREQDDVAYVGLKGELDYAELGRLRETVARLAATQPRLLVIDLRCLEFIDSSGMGLIVQADRKMRTQGGRLVVMRGPDNIHRRFVLARLENTLNFTERAVGGPWESS